MDTPILTTVLDSCVQGIDEYINESTWNIQFVAGVVSLPRVRAYFVPFP